MHFAHHKKAYEHPLNKAQLHPLPQRHPHLKVKRGKKRTANKMNIKSNGEEKQLQNLWSIQTSYDKMKWNGIYVWKRNYFQT